MIWLRPRISRNVQYRNPRESNNADMNVTCPLIVSVLALSVPCVVEGATVGQYSFDSTFSSHFTLAMGSGVTFTDNAGVGVMMDSAAVGEELSAYTWNGQSLTAGQSWILTVDASISDAFSALIDGVDAFAGLGLVAARSTNSGNHMTLLAWADGDPSERGLDATLDGNLGNFDVVRPLGETTSLMLSYDADTKILTAHDTNGSALRTVNVATTWGMGDTDTFAFGVIGNSEGGQIPSDQDYLWLDNLQLETVPEPSSVMMLGLSGVVLLGRRAR